MARKTKEQIEQEQQTKLAEFKNIYLDYFHESFREEEEETTQEIALRTDFAERMWTKILKEYTLSELELFVKYLTNPIVKKMMEAKIQERYGDLVADVNLELLVEEAENTDLDEVGSWDFNEDKIIPPVRH